MKQLTPAQILQKAAALDPKQLPPGTEYPTPYELKWKTPAGHALQHNVKPEIVDHGLATSGDEYYKKLVEAIDDMSRRADERAPGDIANDLQLQRLGGGLTGATLGGLGGLLLGTTANHPALGTALGGVGGGLLGYHLTKGTPKTHMEYNADEDFDPIPQLWARTPEDDEVDDRRAVREALERMDRRDARRDFHDHMDRIDRGRYDPFWY